MDQSIPSVALTNCFAIATHPIIAMPESTSDVHPNNSLMVSNLTTGNSGQLKMSPLPPKKGDFGIGPLQLPQICEFS